MDLVFQVRLTAEETAQAAREPNVLWNLSIIMSVTMETAQRASDKPIRGEIVDDKGTVLQRVP